MAVDCEVTKILQLYKFWIKVTKQSAVLRPPGSYEVVPDY